jgi:hypothetical protein
MRPLFLSPARIGQLALCNENHGKRADSRLRRGRPKMLNRKRKTFVRKTKQTTLDPLPEKSNP